MYVTISLTGRQIKHCVSNGLLSTLHMTSEQRCLNNAGSIGVGPDRLESETLG
jgi:hypothetical protein